MINRRAPPLWTGGVPRWCAASLCSQEISSDWEHSLKKMKRFRAQLSWKNTKMLFHGARRLWIDRLMLRLLEASHKRNNAHLCSRVRGPRDRYFKTLMNEIQTVFAAGHKWEINRVTWPFKPSWTWAELEPDVSSSGLPSLAVSEVAEPLTTAWPRWDDKNKMKRLSVVLQQTAIFLTPHALLKNLEAITISLQLDMKWAHIINISILFDCPPNKSHCSNKQRAPLHCLPLSGFELLTLQLAIYYRHLSQVTDKHCDGCMIWLRQNGFISPLQATIASQLMSCAYSLPSDFLSTALPFSHPSDGNRCESYPPKSPFHQEQTYSIIYRFSYLCTLWLLPLSPVYLLVCALHVCVDGCTSTCARAAFIGAGQKTDCVFLMLFHIVILSSGCNIPLFRNPTINHLNCCWQTSKCFDLLLIFFLLVTLKWIEIQRSRNYRMARVFARACPLQSV